MIVSVGILGGVLFIWLLQTIIDMVFTSRLMDDPFRGKMLATISAYFIIASLASVVSSSITAFLTCLPGAVKHDPSTGLTRAWYLPRPVEPASALERPPNRLMYSNIYPALGNAFVLKQYIVARKNPSNRMQWCAVPIIERSFGCGPAKTPPLAFVP